MKKLLLSLTLLASIARAEDVNLGVTFTAANSNAQQTASVMYGRQLGTNTLRQIAVDASGAFASSTTTASSSAIESATTTQAFWTQTPVAYNLSTTAGVAGKKYIVTIQPNFGGAAVFCDFSLLTWTAAINDGYGSYLPTTLTGGVAYGPYVAGFHTIIKSSTATGVSGVVRVEAVP
jgi:hypothetical protein